MSRKECAWLGLGTNLGDREAHLARARDLLAAADLTIVRASSIYETEPRDLPGQPWFLNQVVEVSTSLDASGLLALALDTERQMGRERIVPKGPRVIDIDVLLHGSSIVSRPGLEIPHPRMAARRFVLEPLAEIAPDLRHPVTGATIAEMLEAVRSQDVRKR